MHSHERLLVLNDISLARLLRVVFSFVSVSVSWKTQRVSYIKTLGSSVNPRRRPSTPHTMNRCRTRCRPNYPVHDVVPLTTVWQPSRYSVVYVGC